MDQINNEMDWLINQCPRIGGKMKMKGRRWPPTVWCVFWHDTSMAYKAVSLRRVSDFREHNNRIFTSNVLLTDILDEVSVIITPNLNNVYFLD